MPILGPARLTSNARLLKASVFRPSSHTPATLIVKLKSHAIKSRPRRLHASCQACSIALSWPRGLPLEFSLYPRHCCKVSMRRVFARASRTGPAHDTDARALTHVLHPSPQIHQAEDVVSAAGIILNDFERFQDTAGPGMPRCSGRGSSSSSCLALLLLSVFCTLPHTHTLFGRSSLVPSLPPSHSLLFRPVR